MVPEGPQEGAALSAPDTTAEGNPEAEAEVAESTEVAVGGSTGLSWVDISEAADNWLYRSGRGCLWRPRWRRSRRLWHSEVWRPFFAWSGQARRGNSWGIVWGTEANPASEPADQPTASDPVEANNNLEIENPNNQIPKEETDFTNNPEPQETVAEVADTVADPILGSSPTLEEVHDPNSIVAPVYVEYPAEAAEEDEVPPPPTSPFLEQVGAAAGASTSGHVQTGHSPSAPSRPPRIRGTKGGKRPRQSEFWLRYVHHSEASAELIWTIRVFRVLYNHCIVNQILVHFANTYPPYRNWVFFNGYRRGELSSAPDLVARTVLPDRDHINLQACGEADPPRSVWDDYNTYRGAQPQGKAKSSMFVQNTEPPSEPEQKSTLGTDPAVRRDVHSSEETHTPSPRGPPKAKARPKEQPKPPTAAEATGASTSVDS